MKESIANAYIFNIVIVFVVIFIFFFAGSLTYSKAFKVKNRIIDIIEKYEKYDKDVVVPEISDTLTNMGYRIDKSGKTPDQYCPSRNGQNAISFGNNYGHKYCVYKYQTSKGIYYGVAAYMYFDIPIIGQSLEFPVYGETKVMGILN